jgi:hypothetical protein
MKLLTQIWYARGCQVLADGRIQQSTQTDADGNVRHAYHPTLALICHLGSPTLATHIVNLHNASLNETNASQEVQRA